MKQTGAINEKLTEKQIARLYTRWALMERRGPALHTLIFGTALFLWMCICYVFFIDLTGHLCLLREPFVVYSTLPCLLFLACAAPMAQYWSTRQMVRRISAAKA